MAEIRLIVGLGNPGKDYEGTRHNAGAFFVQELARRSAAALCTDSKFFGETARINFAGRDLRILIPSTFMNRSGKSVAAMANFYRIAPDEILIAHDELDIPPGQARFKQGGGHGGHNGIRDIIKVLGGNSDFFRLRIGVGHPGHKSMVAKYVLSDPSRSEADIIMRDIEDAIRVMPQATSGRWEEAMRLLHT